MAPNRTAMQKAERLLRNVKVTASNQSNTVSAAQRVFGIAELFDAVMLLELDPQQLFVNIHVCRSWRAYITRSKVLQTRMFLLPGPAVHNPFLVKINPWVTKILKASDYRTLSPASHKPRKTSYRMLMPRRPAWTGSGSSMRRTLLVRSRVQDACLSIMMRVEDEYTGRSRLVSLNFADDYNPPLEVVARMMGDKIAEDEYGRIGLSVTELAVHWTTLYDDGVRKVVAKIASGLRCKDRDGEDARERARRSAAQLARYQSGKR
ncbi:hypothetical protein LTR56_011628 [Elasticomyces elasticus]|nr:hypothetical protein LTR56_011628 [Elasticomyces elasticus]KAK4905336.1 hypothetical protein LTR49_025359 [Elasticomyces elasticus]KAK5765338.1 hypothetical protein LTS12_004595 [Elasticomyces elasticus]